MLWLQVYGEEDLANNNRRNVVLNQTYTESDVVELPVVGGGLTFGVYRFTINISESESGSEIGIAVSFTSMQPLASFAKGTR